MLEKVRLCLLAFGSMIFSVLALAQAAGFLPVRDYILSGRVLAAMCGVALLVGATRVLRKAFRQHETLPENRIASE